jgi:hypothetical protein
MSNYRVPIHEYFEWQKPVLRQDRTNEPGSPSPVKGDRYLILSTPSSLWTGQINKIAEYDGANWFFVSYKEGMVVYVIEQDLWYLYQNAAWGIWSVSGYSGFSGYSGSGISGYSGSGVSGYSGYSGKSGYSGITPTTVVYPAASISVTTGTLNSGNLASIQTYNDANVYNVQEVTGVPGFDVRIGFTGVSSFNMITLNQYYTGNLLHNINIQLYNNSTAGWDTFGSISNESGLTLIYLGVAVSTNYINAGAVSLRYYHTNSGNATHQIQIDYALLSYSIEGAVGLQGSSGTSGYSGYSGSGVSGYSGSGISGYSGSGISGYSGYSGISGYSGYSGISGYSGPPNPVGNEIARIVTTGSQATVDFQNIPSYYRDLEIRFQARSNVSATNENLYLKLNNDGTIGNYSTYTQVLQVTNVGAGATVFTNAGGNGPRVGTLTGNTSVANAAAEGKIWINNYTGTTFAKTIMSNSKFINNAAYTNTSAIILDDETCVWNSTAAVTRVTFTAPTSFVDGSTFILYGVGSTTTSGYSGISGYSGSGISGYSGSGISGYSGSGISGYSGYSGISGYSGYSGISGYSGRSGYSGYSGSGISGYSGSGISGYSGSGISGYSGRSGYSGYSGISGYSGYSGISGYSGSGISGYSGSGISGYSGSGISGYSGRSGYSGSGISGYSGSGISGYSGSGISGYSGSGISGYSGSGISGYSGAFAGSGSSGYIPKFTGANALANSTLFNTGVSLLIGASGIDVPPTYQPTTYGISIDGIGLQNHLSLGTAATNQYASWIQSYYDDIIGLLSGAIPLALNPSGGNVTVGAPIGFTSTGLLHVYASGVPLALERAVASTGGANIIFRKARGTPGSPSQTLAGDALGLLIGRGYTNSSAFSVNNDGTIGIYAEENQTSSANGTYIAFGTTPSGTAGTVYERVRITGSGALIINNTSVTYDEKLSVTGTITSSTTANRGAVFANTFVTSGDRSPGQVACSPIFSPGTGSTQTAAYGLILNAKADLNTSGGIADMYAFFCRCDTGDNTSGTLTTITALNIANPLLGALKPTTIYGVRIRNQGETSTTTSYGLYMDAQSGSTNSYGAYFASNVGFGVTTPGVAVDVSGDIRATGNITAYYSDIKMKTGIRLISDPLEKLNKLRGVDWTWDKAACEKANFYPSEDENTGVIAQEVQAVLPHAVIPSSNPDYLSIKLSNQGLIAVLIESVKELQKQIKDLQAKVK